MTLARACMAVLMVGVVANAAPAGEKAKTFWEEHTLFAYIENSYVWNLGNTSRGRVNDLRYYDFDAGYTFNIAEFSIKKGPSERYPFGYGLVLTGGMDSQKNHALGIFRGDDDQFAFRNTPRFDLQEAYGAYKIPLGSGLTLKAGKFVTLLGYEVIEAPNNLNFSRGSLFTFSTPLTQRNVVHWPDRAHASEGSRAESQLDHRARAEPSGHESAHRSRRRRHLYRHQEADPGGQRRCRLGDRRAVAGGHPQQ